MRRRTSKRCRRRRTRPQAIRIATARSRRTGSSRKAQLEQGGSALKVAQADVKSASVALQRAKQNLSFTSIYAPIDGVVIERNVNNGQTVAASLSAPQLFLIANDLSHMQILAQVGESDIDQIKQGQPVKFTVQALPGRTFTGIVQQVRLQSTTADNVVNYTVVVTLENPDGKLLPGMTARVDFLVKSATNVLKVSNAALRYKPSAEVLAQFGAATTSKDATTTTGSNPRGGNRGQCRRNARSQRPGKWRRQRLRHAVLPRYAGQVAGRARSHGHQRRRIDRGSGPERDRRHEGHRRPRVDDGIDFSETRRRRTPLGGTQQGGRARPWRRGF